MAEKAVKKPTEYALEKKYSPGVREAAEEWLAKSGLTLGRLSREQAEAILEHFRERARLKWFVLTAVVMLAVAGSAVAVSVSLLPQTLDVLVENQPRPDMLSRLAFGSAACGAVVALVVFAAVAAITTTVGQIYRSRETTRLIEKFLSGHHG